MSDYRRGYNWENIQYIPAPTGGWNSDTVPWLLAEDQASALDNFIIRPGNIQPRGPITNIASLGSFPFKPIGFLPAASLGIGCASTSGVLPWDAPAVAAASAYLATASTTVTWADPNGNLTTSTAASADHVPGPRWINFNGTLFGLGFDSANSAVMDAGSSYFIKPSQLLSIASKTGSSATSGSLTPGDPTVTQTVTSAVDWTTLDNLGDAPTGGRAIGPALTSGQVTEQALFTHWGFHVPSTATITGVSVTINRADLSNTRRLRDATVQVVKAGAATGTNKAQVSIPWPVAGSGSVTYGGSTDLWGTTLVPSDVNNTGFGLAVSTDATGGTSGAPRVLVNNITIYYTLPSSFTTPALVSGAPTGAIDLTGYQSRIWLAAGVNIPGSGTTHDPTAVYFTNTLDTWAGATPATADWKDTASGLVNRIVIDNDNGDPIMGFGRVRNALIIFRRNSVWALKGTTTANYAIAPISSSVGCLDPRSIVETDNGVYFMSLQGLEFTNGTSISNVSGNVRYTLQQAVATEQWSVMQGASGMGGFISCGLTSQGHVMVSIGTTDPTGTMRSLWSGMFDAEVIAGGAWTRITSNLWGTATNNNLPSLFVTNRLVAQHSLHVVDNQNLYTLEDQAIGQSFLIAQGLFEATGSGVLPAYQPIPYRWSTRFVSTVGTTALARKYGAPTRYFLDHTFAANNLQTEYATPGVPGTYTPVDPQTGWQVTPINPEGEPYDPLAVMHSSVSDSVLVLNPTMGAIINTQYVPAESIQRDNQDFPGEISDVAFVVEWPTLLRLVDGTTEPMYAEGDAAGVVGSIYGIGMEYQPSMNLRTVS